MTRKSKKSLHQLVVQYKLVNGSHFFVGDERCPETTGLCVGSRNLRDAFDQVGPALSYLLKKNYDVETPCVPSRTFHEFRQWLLAGIDGVLLGDDSAARFDSVTAFDPGKAKQWTIPTGPADLMRSASLN